MGQQPIGLAVVETIGEHSLRLRVTDALGVTAEASVDLLGLAPLPGIPLSADLFTADFVGQVPFSTSVFGLAQGGVEPYEYSLAVDGVALYEDNTGPVHITELGNHEVTFVVVDAEGSRAEASVNILGLAPTAEPLMRIGFVATPSDVHVGEQVALLTTVYGGQPPYVFAVSVDGVLITDIPMSLYQAGALGQHVAHVRVTDATGMSSEMSSTFNVTAAPLYVPPLTIDVTATPWTGVAPFYTSLHADVRGGTPPYTVDWYDESGIDIGDTENLHRLMSEQGQYVFEARVTDAIGKLASESVVVSATAPNIVAWSVPTTLKVGPSDDEDGASITTGQPTGQNHLWFYMRLDVVNQSRGDTVIEAVYANNSRRYWVVPDVLPQRPACVLVDGGEALIEPVVRVNLYYTGSYEKCDNWYRLLEIHGSRVVPAKLSTVPLLSVAASSQRPSVLSN